MMAFHHAAMKLRGAFFVYGIERDCTWLSARSKDLQVVVCDENLAAFDACHETCGAVNGRHPCNPDHLLFLDSLNGNNTYVEENPFDENVDGESNPDGT
mmetsp:Transcript_13331/g.36771  ORF Transcript_13331/g.36771 Transcript_13331/m.36771 type:complete len:99 (+) Transcript_13331:1105-1401(+)